MSAVVQSGPGITEPVPAGNVHQTTAHYRRQSRLLYLLIIAIVSTCVLVLLGGSTASAPWLVVLFAVGILTTLLLPTIAAGLVVLGLLALWAVVRYTVDQWGVPQLPLIALEVGGLALTFLVSLRFQRQWATLRKETLAVQTQQEKLGIAQVEAEVLPYAIGELRLTEEIDRAAHFGRPLAVLVVESQFTRSTLSADERARLDRALKRQIATHTSLHDIPFQIDEQRVGIILPERNWLGAMQELYLLEESLSRTGETHGLSRMISEVMKITIALKGFDGAITNARDLIDDADIVSKSNLLSALGKNITVRAPRREVTIRAQPKMATVRAKGQVPSPLPLSPDASTQPEQSARN
jgi:hypothetical protein